MGSAQPLQTSKVGASRASVARKQRQTHLHFNTALDITDVQRTAMQLHDFLNKIQPQTGAFSPAARAR